MSKQLITLAQLSEELETTMAKFQKALIVANFPSSDIHHITSHMRTLNESIHYVLCSQLELMESEDEN